MTVFSAVLLGIVQGITEFLPISSSAHLALAERLFGIGRVPDFYDLMLHLGTLITIFIAYWSEIWDMVMELTAIVRDLRHGGSGTVPPARRMILLIIVGTLPLFLVLPVKSKIGTLSENLFFVGAALLVTAAILYLSDRFARGRKTERSATLLDALLVGCAQALATCPGISRSGSTISVGCLRGFQRSFAVRYSFILSIPAVLGANLLSFKDALEAGIDLSELPVCLIGVAVAALVGLACIRLLQWIAEKGRFTWFSIYCAAVGLITLIVSFVGLIRA